MDHYIGLFSAYAVVTALRFSIQHFQPEFIPTPKQLVIAKPGRELLYLLMTVAAIIGIGQLYTADLLIPAIPTWDGLTESLNQVLIFSPVFLFLYLCQPSPESLFLVRENWFRRLTMGLILAVVALFTFWLATPAQIDLVTLFAEPLRPGNIDFPVQVFFEDLLIAMFLARLSVLTSVRKTVMLVALAFAAAHIPAFLASGDTPQELLSLIADAALGAMVFGMILKTRDFLWIFPVHWVMDTTQFHF